MSELFEKMKAAQTVEEVLSIAAANGVEITADQAKEFFEKKDTLEMADEELGAVAGGGGAIDVKGDITIQWYKGDKMNDIWAKMEPLKASITARGTSFDAVKNHIRDEAGEYLNVVNLSFRYYASRGGVVTIKEDGSFS